MPDQQQSLFFNEKEESDNTERKSCSDGNLPTDIWESITGFSNADGGYIFLGVDNDGDFIGLSSANLDKLQTDLISLCSSIFNHKIYPEVSVFEEAIKVYIPPAPASLRPIYTVNRGLPKGARVRVGSSNVQVDSHWIRKFALEASGGAELQEYRDDPGTVIDTSKVRAYINLVNERRGNVLSNLNEAEVLKKLRAINEDGKLTLFGLLAFGKEDKPQSIAGPTVNVAVTQYPGTTKIDEANPGASFIDNREFDGDVLSQFTEAFSFIRSKLPVRGVIGESGIRQDYLAVPDVAIREALANAIAHRDYTDLSGRTQVDIYSDRIEFSNPGTSLVPIADIENAPPRTRNPLLVNFLKEFGVTEQRARGIRAIISSLRDAGLKPPIFEHRHNSFFATIYSSAFITQADRQWLSRFESKLTERQLKVVLHLKHNKEQGINNTDYREINNMNNVGDDIRAKKDLAKLVQIGILVPRGENRYRRYYLAESLTKE